MRYAYMLPHQIRTAIAENWPCILPMGVLEYHAEHLAVGVDTFAVDGCLARLEQEINVVVLPPFWYGAGSYVVAAPEGNGTVQVDSDALMPLARALFTSLLRIGFRNIHGIIHHQSENFAAGMPTDLAFKTAARSAVFELLQREKGEGWWGREEMQDYYAQHEQNANPFNWIRFHALMDEAIIAQYDFDHAGVGETSLMMALCPEGVDMDRHTDAHWYARSAVRATPAYGEHAVALILARLRQILTTIGYGV